METSRTDNASQTTEQSQIRERGIQLADKPIETKVNNKDEHYKFLKLMWVIEKVPELWDKYLKVASSTVFRMLNVSIVLFAVYSIY